MKKYILSAILLAAATTLQAQDTGINTAADAVRFSVNDVTGTARFTAMGGAFGALGGDLSAIGVNPAGAAVFNYNTFSGSLTSFNSANHSNYFGTETRQRDNSFNVNQIGAVFVFTGSNEQAVLRKFTLGFNYDNTNNFDTSIFTAGNSPTSGAGSYFLNYANGVSPNTLNNGYFENLNFAEQQAYLGYNAYVFNPIENSPGRYQSNIPDTGNYYEENRISNRGYNGKLSFNFAAQLQDWLYLGANINTHFTDFIQTTSFYENYNTTGSQQLRALRFNNERYTYGAGISFSAGAIAKVTESFRAGLSYDSPTWYNLQDELQQSIASNCPGCDGTNNSQVFVDPGVTFIFNDYTIQTPSRYSGSLAYIFGKSGLISADYSIKDYNNTQYTDNGYDAINSELAISLQAASELRVGGEYRIKNFSLRGGYRFSESPYKNSSIMGNTNAYSGGFGFAFNNQRLDFAYTYLRRDISAPLLPTAYSNAASVENINNNVVMTYTIDF